MLKSQLSGPVLLTMRSNVKVASESIALALSHAKLTKIQTLIMSLTSATTVAATELREIIDEMARREMELN